MAPTVDVQRLTPDEWIEELDRLLHHGTAPAAVALTDLDGFAEVNTVHGHEVGNRVLRAWERTVAGSLPPGGRVARIGGDEYAIALPGQSAENALIVLEEVREHFAGHPVKGVDLPLNASLGIAAAPTHATNANDLHRAAGEALMRAKREGRARAVIYVEEKMTLKSNYYSRANLDRLAKLAGATGRTEASLLREALTDLFEKYRDEL